MPRRVSSAAVAHPLSLRLQAVAAYKAGTTSREVGERFGVSQSTVALWARLDRVGDLGPGRPGPASVWTRRRLLALLAMHRRLPRATAPELALLMAPKIGRCLPGYAIRRALAEARRLEQETDGGR